MRSISNLIEWLGDDFQFKILTANHDKGDTQPYAEIEPGLWYKIGKAEVRYLAPNEFQLRILRRIMTEIDFDILYLNSILASLVIRLLLLYRLRLVSHKPIIVAPRGHLDRGALSLKAAKKRLFLRIAKITEFFRDVTWHASSEGEREDIIREFGREQTQSIHVIPNLLAADIGSKPARLLDKQAGELRLVFLSRIARGKNLDFMLHVLQGLQGKITFDIYGPIEDEAYWAECQLRAQMLSPTISVTYRGIVPADEVVSVLSGYQLFVLPTLGENFGHVIVEALYAGCPVLISDRTPWSDVEAKGAGWIVPLEGRGNYLRVLQTMVALDTESFASYSAAAASYGKERIHDQFTLDATKQLLLTVFHQVSPNVRK